MSKFLTILLTFCLVAVLAGGALAAPRLQTYIVGSEYGSYGLDTNSWITQNTSFDLKVSGYWAPGSHSRPYYDIMGVGLIIGVPTNETGSVRINGVEITSFYNLPSSLQNSGFVGGTPMSFAKINVRGLGYVDNNQTGTWHYDRGSIHSPGWGDEILLDVAVEGFSWSHFGALGINRYGSIFKTDGYHDAAFHRGGGSGYATPEPGTLSLLGLGLLGLTPFLKKKKRS